MQNTAENKHQVSVFNRNSVEINCVISVNSLDEESVILETEKDSLAVEGMNLKIENFEKSTGRILIIGDIRGVYYLEKRIKRKGRTRGE